MTGATVVVVDPYSSGAALPAMLRRTGLRPVTVAAYPPPAPVLAAAPGVPDLDLRLGPGDTPEQVAAALRPRRPVAVVPGTESGVPLADALAAALTPALANDPATAAARRHKGRMVAAVRAAGLPVIRTVTSGDPAEVGRWLTANGLLGAHLVVKPPASAGTDGVTLVRGGAGWRAAMAALQGRRNLMGLVDHEVVVQERVTGTEYVVDTFTADGRHTVTNICRYAKTATDGGGMVYESMEFLPYAGRGHPELVDYVTGVLDALGVRFGPAHSEVMMTGSGPLLIETGARLAGAGLPGATRLATGDSGADRLIARLTGRPSPADYRLERCVLVAYFVVRSAGVLRNVAAYERVRALPTCRHLRVNVRDGDRVPATSDLMSTLGLGWAVLAHRDPARVAADHAALRELEAEVRIEPEVPARSGTGTGGGG